MYINKWILKVKIPQSLIMITTNATEQTLFIKQKLCCLKSWGETMYQSWKILVLSTTGRRWNLGSTETKNFLNKYSQSFNDFGSHSGLTCFYGSPVWAIPKYAILWTRIGIKIWEINGTTRFEVTGPVFDWSSNKSPVFTPLKLSTLSRTSKPIPKNWDQPNKEKYLWYFYFVCLSGNFI